MWHIRTMLIGMLGAFFVLAPGLRADSLQLKNGNFVQGKYLGGTERAVQFEVNGKIRLYDIDEILSISFAAASADGGISSNNSDDQKPRTNTGSNSAPADNGGLLAAGQVKGHPPSSRRTALIQNQTGTCQRQSGRSGGGSQPSRVYLAPNSDPRAPLFRVSSQSPQVLPSSSLILSD